VGNRQARLAVPSLTRVGGAIVGEVAWSSELLTQRSHTAGIGESFMITVQTAYNLSHVGLDWVDGRLLVNKSSLSTEHQDGA